MANFILSSMNERCGKPGHVLITGASSGIGRALALRYAAPGIRLSLQGRNKNRLDEICGHCMQKGAIVGSYAGDVRDREGLAAWILQVDDIQPVDLVIANAGISGGTGGEADGESAQQVRAIFDVNVTGVFNTIDPVLPRMISRKRGRVALMSSLAAFRGWPGAPAYCASKAAVKVYGEGLRGSLRGTGVRVNVICPGFVKSPMTDANDYAMPFMIGAEKAASVIARGLENDRSRICFPLPTAFFAWFFGLLPDNLAQILLKRTPKKGTVKEPGIKEG